MASPVVIPQIKLLSQITQFATHIQKFLPSCLSLIMHYMSLSCDYHFQLLLLFDTQFASPHRKSYLLICLLWVSHVIFTCSFFRRLMPNLQCEMPITLKQALFDTILSLSFCTLFASCMILRKIVVLDFFVKLNHNILPYDEGVRNGRMNKFIPL
jgi:hypothetical protein